MFEILGHSFLPIIALAAMAAMHVSVDARMMDTKTWYDKKSAAMTRVRASLPQAQNSNGGTEVKNITFTNPRASEFYVDGTTIPDVDFDIGPSWSGLLPISSDPNETRKLFFWFFPPGPGGSLEDLIFWMNGGPGCSSLKGLLQETGPFQWSYGQARPTRNEFSWTNLSSIIFVDQPVGTGFSQGVPNIKDEDDLAAQLVGFMQQFLEVFSELQGNKLYITGESYAGRYVPYLANYIYEQPRALNLSLEGIWIADGFISYDVVQQQIPALNLVRRYQNIFAFNQTFLAHLEHVAARCGYSGYVQEYLKYPPKGLLPLPDESVLNDEQCDIFDEIIDAALEINPAFNIYRITDTWPVLWDVLGFPGTFVEEQGPIYFDRPEVKTAIHAPANVTWSECPAPGVHVFPTGDASDSPAANNVLPNVIQKSKRSVIVHGMLDFVLMAEGTRIAIQNMTWGGLQGFQSPIKQDSFIVDGMGALGTAHTERKLTYYEVELSGHMVPQFSPKAAMQTMQYLMDFRHIP